MTAGKSVKNAEWRWLWKSKKSEEKPSVAFPECWWSSSCQGKPGKTEASLQVEAHWLLQSAAIMSCVAQTRNSPQGKPRDGRGTSFFYAKLHIDFSAFIPCRYFFILCTLIGLSLRAKPHLIGSIQYTIT